MKRFALTLGSVLVLSCTAAPLAFAGTGNGVPSGPHFTLNVHGVANGQGFNGNNQNEIFVPLGTAGGPAKQCNIDLVQNPLDSSFTDDFQVLQPNCVTESPAQFELPAPCAINLVTATCSSTTTLYSVYARALGKPGPGVKATLDTCFTDTSGTFCSTNAYVAVRGSGPAGKFSPVTSQLLFISGQCVTGTGGTGSTVTPIFGNPNYGYLWQYDNQGLRLLQLRFYQVSSPVPTGISC